MILKEAEENRRKKAEEEANPTLKEPSPVNLKNKRRSISPENEEERLEEEERQKK